jgi:hypothetical protein
VPLIHNTFRQPFYFFSIKSFTPFCWNVYFIDLYGDWFQHYLTLELKFINFIHSAECFSHLDRRKVAGTRLVFKAFQQRQRGKALRSKGFFLKATSTAKIMLEYVQHALALIFLYSYPSGKTELHEIN